MRYLAYDHELTKLRGIAHRLADGRLLTMDDAKDLSHAIAAVVDLIERAPYVEAIPRRASDPPSASFADLRSRDPLIAGPGEKRP